MRASPDPLHASESLVLSLRSHAAEVVSLIGLLACLTAVGPALGASLETDAPEGPALPVLLVPWPEADPETPVAPPETEGLPVLVLTPPAEPLPLEVASLSGDRAPVGGGSGGSGHEIELGLPRPFLPPPRVAPGSTVQELTPPSDANPRWSFPVTDTLSWSSRESSFEGEWAVLRGQVDIRAGLDRIQADHVRLNQTTRKLVAEGNVVLDHLDSRLTGDRMEYDLETNTGTVYDCLGYTGRDVNFTGEKVEKVSDDKFIVYDGSFTTCAQPLPIWQVRASKAIVHLDHFVYTWNPRVFFKKVPAYYLPWAAFPIRDQRTSGFMIPKISTSSRRGASISEEYFWAINRSSDLTVGVQWWEKFGYATELEGRWHLGNMTRPGNARFYYLDAKDEEDSPFLPDTRWHLKFDHQQKIFEDWDLSFSGEAGSDQLIDREIFTGDNELIDRTPVFNQRLNLRRQWGKHGLTIVLQNNERQRQDTPDNGTGYTGNRRDTDINRELPSVEYRANGIQIGGQRWASLNLEGSLARLSVNDQREVGTLFDGTTGVQNVTVDRRKHDYWRADFAPQFRFPVNLEFLEVEPAINLRGTWWSRLESIMDEPITVTDPRDFDYSFTDGDDESSFLWAWDASLRLGGPDFQRIYKRAAAPGQKKWQHLIEPELEFRYTPRVDEDDLTSRDDLELIQGDRRAGTYTGRFDRLGKEIRVGLINTLRSKRVVPVGAQGESAHDLLTWRLMATYDLKDKESTRTFDGRQEESHWSQVSSTVTYRPTPGTQFRLTNNYDILQDDVTSTMLTGGLEGDWGYFDVNFRSRRDQTTLESTQNQLQLFGENYFYKGDRVRLAYNFTRNFTRSNASDPDWPYRFLGVSYFNQCCGVALTWEDRDERSLPREREWELTVSLKDLGNFLRYRNRSRSGQ